MGDAIKLTRRDVGAGWWEGELNGVLGLFPEKFVKEIDGAAAAAGGGGETEGDYIAAAGGIVPRIQQLPKSNPFNAGNAGTAAAAGGGGGGGEAEGDYIAAAGGIVRAPAEAEAEAEAATGNASPKVRPPRPTSSPTKEALPMKFVTVTPTILQGCTWQRLVLHRKFHNARMRPQAHYGGEGRGIPVQVS